MLKQRDLEAIVTGIKRAAEKVRGRQAKVA
jgi:hypothetical protein